MKLFSHVDESLPNKRPKSDFFLSGAIHCENGNEGESSYFGQFLNFQFTIELAPKCNMKLSFAILFIVHHIMNPSTGRGQ